MTRETQATISPEFLNHLTAGLTGAEEPLPSGAIKDQNFTGRFIGANFGVARDSGTAYVNLDFEYLGPDEKLVGIPVSAHFNLIQPKNFEVFKSAIRRLGAKSNEGPTLVAELEAKVGTVWNLTARNRDGYFNLFINRELRQDGAPV